jgi:hypothetical protein
MSTLGEWRQYGKSDFLVEWRGDGEPHRWIGRVCVYTEQDARLIVASVNAIRHLAETVGVEPEVLAEFILREGAEWVRRGIALEKLLPTEEE